MEMFFEIFQHKFFSVGSDTSLLQRCSLNTHPHLYRRNQFDTQCVFSYILPPTVTNYMNSYLNAAYLSCFDTLIILIIVRSDHPFRILLTDAVVGLI